MAGFNFQFGSGGPGTQGGSVGSRVFLFLFALPFAGFGLFAVWGGINRARNGNVREGIFVSLFGLVFAAIGFGLMYAAIAARKLQKAADDKWAAQTDGGEKIWLARPDWAAGKIKSSTASQWKVFLFMGLMFSGIGGIASFFALKEEIPKGNHGAWLALIFPLIGLGFLVAVGRESLVRRRFGDCTFNLAQVPAPLGGTISGLIQTSRPLKLEQGLHLKLSCINRTTSGSGKNRRTQESVLWQEQKVFRSDASLPATGFGGTGIPVHFNLPTNQPESSLRGSTNIIWRLDARAKMSGPDFTAVFDVPVFRVAGAVAATPKDLDPTAPLQMSVEEIRRDEHSKIQINDMPGGKEFYFPAARNISTAIVLTVFLVIWSGVVWLMSTHGAPIVFSIVFGLVDIFIFWGCVSLWFKSSRVTVNSSGVTLKNRFLLFGRTRQFDAGEIVRFDTKAGMTSGSKVFSDLKLVTPQSEESFAARKARYQQAGQSPPLNVKAYDASGVTLASSIASKAEADWLVCEMTRALGRKI
jgi:hypothetical protein